jgi:UDP-glucose 4-epimerase
VVQANIKAAEAIGVSGAFNIASGTSITINGLVKMITKNNNSVKIEYGAERPGDVRDSLADISMAHQKFNFKPTVDIDSGIEKYIEWAQDVS